MGLLSHWPDKQQQTGDGALDPDVNAVLSTYFQGQQFAWKTGESPGRSVESGSLEAFAAPIDAANEDGRVTSTSLLDSGLVPQMSFSPIHPLALSKHLCAICGDRASGKHYGVYSCEGCKGFFKRTVRKDLSYTCRDTKDCLIDKRQRNRCQFCRYKKCYEAGMKREAVQEERQTTTVARVGGLKGDERRTTAEAESSVSSCTDELQPDTILDAEHASESLLNNITCNNPDSCASLSWQTCRLIDWAQMIPAFNFLTLQDQAVLIHGGWHELILADVAFRSSRDTLMLWPERPMNVLEAARSGCRTLFFRILNELAAKMREIVMDRMELGALRLIVLFDPNVPGLENANVVTTQRTRVYQCLDDYCRSEHGDEPQRFTKLLLRIPTLSSIAMQCRSSGDLVICPPSIQVILQRRQLNK